MKRIMTVFVLVISLFVGGCCFFPHHDDHERGRGGDRHEDRDRGGDRHERGHDERR